MTRLALALPLVLATALPAAAGNVTRQQSCQLMANHVADILESRDWADEAAREIGVLKTYAVAQGAIIDEEIADSATQMSMPVEDIQAMVDQQGAMLDAQIDEKYGDKLYRDYTVALFDCAKMSPERLGSSPEDFVATLEQIGNWAQINR